MKLPKSSRSVLAALACLISLSTHGFAAEISTRFVPFKNGALSVRVQTYSPTAEPRGDILFLHGFADRADNHGPLFEEWTRQGFRVIAFDLPSHGETSGPASDLNAYSFEDLSRLAIDVEQLTRQSAERPLLLSGWSTGGLLAVRMLQSPQFAHSDRPISGAILFAPGVAVRPVVGTLGVVTQSTLTRNPNPPHAGPIKPLSPFLKPVFATRLLLNALLSQHESIDRAVPTLVFVGGEKEDRYVETDKVKTWVMKQRASGADIVAVELPGGFHELDNEPGAAGAAVRATAGQFAANILAGRSADALVVENPCQLLLLGH